MFELGLDQAQGLKRMFMPLTSGRVNVVGVGSDQDIAGAVIGVGRALIERGFDVQWEDPEGLLPPALPISGDDDGAQIVVAASRDADGSVNDGQVPDYVIFAAQPHPDQITELYSTLKAASLESDPYGDTHPFTVMWCEPQRTNQQLRSVCESNLSEAVERFLNRKVEFVSVSDRSSVSDRFSEQGPDTISETFVERLSSFLLSRLGQLERIAPTLAN